MRTFHGLTALFTRLVAPALLVTPLAMGLGLGTGCSNDDHPKEDLAMGGADLATSRHDLAAPGPDLAGGPADMAGASDLAGTSDLAVVSDLAGKSDLAVPVDLASKPDLAVPGDLAVPADLPMPGDFAVPIDLAVRPDLAGPLPDLSTPTVDMAGGHVVTGLPTCTVTGVTADTVFTDVAKASCASGTCHNVGAAGLAFTSGATFKSALVGVASGQTMLMPRVTAGNVDASYLMYKLVGQHAAVGGRGELMPKGGMRLTDPNLCKFIVWIKEGAK